MRSKTSWIVERRRRSLSADLTGSSWERPNHGRTQGTIERTRESEPENPVICDMWGPDQNRGVGQRLIFRWTQMRIRRDREPESRSLRILICVHRLRPCFPLFNEKIRVFECNPDGRRETKPLGLCVEADEEEGCSEEDGSNH